MRPWLVAVVLLVGCDGVPREFRSGQALWSAGQEPWGGVYNPHLAGCTLTDTDVTAGSVVTVTWDDRGRQLARDYALDSEGVRYAWSLEWDGPCVVREAFETVSGGSGWTTDETRCDEQGWPVSTTRTGSSASGEPYEPEEFTYENTYDGDDLVRLEDGFGTVTELVWADRRRVRADVAASDGSTSATTFDYTDDGWIRERDDGEDVATFVYDIAGRLTRATFRDTAQEWTYASEKADHPGLRTYIDAEGNEYPTELVWECP